MLDPMVSATTYRNIHNYTNIPVHGGVLQPILPPPDITQPCFGHWYAGMITTGRISLLH